MKHRSRIYFMISFAWLFGACVSVLPAANALSSMEYFPSVLHCTIQMDGKRIRVLFGFVCFCILPIIMMVNYGVITHTLWKQSKKLSMCSQDRKQSHVITKREICLVQANACVTERKPNLISVCNEKNVENDIEKSESPTYTHGNDAHDGEKSEDALSHCHCDEKCDQSQAIKTNIMDKKEAMVFSDISSCSEHTTYDMVHPKQAVTCKARKEKKHYKAQKRVTIIGNYTVIILFILTT